VFFVNQLPLLVAVSNIAVIGTFVNVEIAKSVAESLKQKKLERKKEKKSRKRSMKTAIQRCGRNL
jgi:rRNA processing protein Krr1/Pno1